MAFAAFRSALRSRRLGWLLAFALWLPVAQWASASHALLHLHASVKEQRDPASLAASACDLCVVAAALGSGAPTPVIAMPAGIELPHATPAFAPRAHHIVAPARFYASRAPPSLHA